MGKTSTMEMGGRRGWAEMSTNRPTIKAQWRETVLVLPKQHEWGFEHAGVRIWPANSGMPPHLLGEGLGCVMLLMLLLGEWKLWELGSFRQESMFVESPRFF